MSELKSLTLDALHRELGGKMVPFAGYEMPVAIPRRCDEGTPAHPQPGRPV